MNPYFQKNNNIVGWAVFAIALITYWITMEETASYWDCGEFISVSYKLEVPHPPGAPLFLLMGRLFSFLAFGDVTKVAYWINFSSVLASAFTVLFLFWSITLFGRKLMKISKPEELTMDKTWVLLGAGIVGSLAYTFSDSAWFSAVEAEVYAMSSFFTAFVVWAMLKWEVIEDESKANRWLLLIFYMMGLSIGIHLLNLVTIPALALVYYFKKYKPTPWGVVAAMLVSLGIIFVINEIIIPGLPTIAGQFEVIFVNSFGLPFGSGAVAFTVLLVGGMVWGIYFSQKNNRVVLNLILNAVAFILIGYASYALVVIRSNDNTPINENDPSDIMAFVSYLKREQYGSRPLLYGPYYTSQAINIKYGAPIYKKGKDKYEIVDRKFEYVYDYETFLPRVWNTEANNVQTYRSFLGLAEGEKPTFADNMVFMFRHQIGWMYVRYFFFNFAGRASDNQDADWIGPFQWFEKLPPILSENKGRNNFFMIPFVLGLVGMFYQAVFNTRNFVVVTLLFVLTGVALVVYLNSPPIEPRERDYIYAGSYYAFCLWIGFAIIALAETLVQVTKTSLKTSAIIATAIGLSAPALMAQQGWDDHNRSNRFFSVDSAVNYLQSCAPNGVLFTGGDNDTFPLWYAQEVEGVRTDVRVVVLSYYNTDWYIDQTMHKVYESEAFPYTLTIANYADDKTQYIPFYDAGIKQMDLNKYLELIRDNNKSLLNPEYRNERYMLPTKEIILRVDVDHVRQLGIVPKELDSLIVPEMRLRVKGGGLERKDLAMLDALASGNWERPLYVNNTSLSQFNVDLSRYVIQEGNAYRILPILNPRPFNQLELVNTDVSYENMLKKFQFRNMTDSTVYYTQDYRNFVLNHRSSFNSLAEALIIKEDTAKAREVLLFSLTNMPDATIRYDYTSAQTVALLLEVGEKEKAIEIVNLMWPRADALADYYIREGNFDKSLQINMAILGELQRVLHRYGEEDLAKLVEDAYTKHANALQLDRSNF